MFCWISRGREERLDPHEVGVKQRAGTLVHPGGPLKLFRVDKNKTPPGRLKQQKPQHDRAKLRTGKITELMTEQAFPLES